jgi:hypothetical protein
MKRGIEMKRIDKNRVAPGEPELYPLKAAVLV